MSRASVGGTRCRHPTVLASVVAIVGVLLFAAGCGSGSSPTVASVASSTTTAAPATTTQNGSSGGAASVGPSARRGGRNVTVINIGNVREGTRFAACMRKHGLPGFPDPNAQGQIQFGSGIAPHSPLFGSAKRSCQALLPAGFGQPPTQAQLRQVQQHLVAFSKCMRAHAISNFPDPSGAELPQIQPTGDLDPNNPQFKTAYNACKIHLPTGLPGKALGGLAPPTESSRG